MNVFVLDENLRQSARFHNDKHVVKMTLEYAQILVSAHWIADQMIGDGWYKPTHLNHPLVKWCAMSRSHYAYVYRLFEAVAEEYNYRYGKIHKSWATHGSVLDEPPVNAGSGVCCTRNIPCLGGDRCVSGVKKFYLAMPLHYRGENISGYAGLSDTVAAYRKYYLGEKLMFSTWRGRDVPHWCHM